MITPISILFLLLSQGAILGSESVEPVVSTEVLSVTQDAEVRQLNPDITYGALDTIQVQSETDPQKGYIQFDASGLGLVCGVKSFRMFSTYQYGRSARFYLIKGDAADDWSEDSLTWNNAPGNDTSSATAFLNTATYTNIFLGNSELVPPDTIAWFLWDSQAARDALVHELNTGNRKVTIAFARNGDRCVQFASADSGTNAMTMELWIVPDSTVLSAVQDAEVKADFPTVNYGTAAVVKAQRDIDPSKGYVQFDASDCGSITDIVSLGMVSTYLYGRSARFYLISGTNVNDWSENSITWNSAPANDTSSAVGFLNNSFCSSLFVGRSESVDQNSVAELIWDSSEAKSAVISALNTGDRKLTLAFARDGDRLVKVASKENPSGGMLLSVREAASPRLLDVVQDALVKKEMPTTNYGSLTVVNARRDLDPTKGYLQFDASHLNLITNVSSLSMISTYLYGRSAEFFLIDGADADDWSEGSITWNNAPGNDIFSATGFMGGAVLLGTSEAVAQNTPTELMWAPGGKEALLNALNTGDRKATVALRRNGDRLVSIASKENGAHAPVQLHLQQSYCPTTDTTISDHDFFEVLSTNCSGLSAAMDAYDDGNINEAKSLLCDYYRNRGTNFWWPEIYTVPDQEEGENMLSAYSNLVNKTGSFVPEFWRADSIYDWYKVDSVTRRMYFFSSLGRAYQYSGDEEIAQAWIGLFRAWIDQMPLADPSSIWITMNRGICLRSGWGDAFNSFMHSPLMSDENLFLFMKSFYEQALYLRHNHSETSNWLTFEMGGLYSAAVLFPEWQESAEWRSYVVQTITNDLDNGWLPDGITIELSPGYGQFFSNYIKISDFAQTTGYGDGPITNVVQKTEDLFSAYLDLMAPGWTTPAFNDNDAVNASDFLQLAADRFPDRQDFQWAASKGSLGTEPNYLSTVFPYAGYLAIRSGWETNANCLFFDAGPVGYRHAHQDKLAVNMWAYGRQVLFDPGRQNYDDSNPYQHYCMDTFSHSTGLVDSRPQRRRWYNNPHPNNMPYDMAEGFLYDLSVPGKVWAAGEYTNSYGLAGGSVSNDAYPYVEDSNFFDGWGTPASHCRQIAYVAPDIFVVQDWFVPNDTSSHDYEIRWQIDSVTVSTNGMRLETADVGMPNLAIIPLRSSGMTVSAVSAATSPDIMGWKVRDVEYPATTLRHIRSGTGNLSFITLLFPLRAGESASSVDSQESGGVITVDVGDGRMFEITPASGPNSTLRVDEF